MTSRQQHAVQTIVFVVAGILSAAFVVSLARGQAPPVPPPLGLKVTDASISLGRMLFFDGRLSVDGTVSCASCHEPAAGWADPRPVSLGVVNPRTGRPGIGTRNAPTILNAVYSPFMFWDGRAVGQAQQALLPLLNQDEMANRSERQVLDRLRGIPGYQAAFLRAYGPPTSGQGVIDALRLAHAIASFESTIVSFNAPIDDRLAGDLEALSPEAEAGFGLFNSTGCTACHKPPIYSDFLFHNNGAEFAARQPGERFDLGRWDVLPDGAKTAAMVRAFKTPTLREIARTAPYNHAGTWADLATAVHHYATGGARSDGKRDRFIDPRVGGIRLSPAQEDLLVRFLAEAFASPDYPTVPAPELPR